MVDFDPKLAEIIAETKYMEMLGFSVPELARNVALQVRAVAHFTVYLMLLEIQQKVMHKTSLKNTIRFLVLAFIVDLW